MFFLGKGHSQAALSLWNNMLEPVGGKQWFWHMGEEFKCPTQEYPYIFTSKNSAKALEEYKHAMNQTTDRAPTDSSSSTAPIVTSTENHKHHKHHKKSDSDSFTRTHYAAFVGLFFLMMIVLIVGVCRRQQVRVFVHGAGRRHINGFTNPQYPDENDDDLEIWNRSNVKSGFSINNDIPKTHGTRISFE
jgi:hypothetical protein